MQSKAATVKEYIASLPPDRQEAIQAVRKVILANIGNGYEEGMTYGMIGYYVPHSIYPAGYHCDPKMPLGFAGLASQKNHMSLYIMGFYVGCDGSESPNLKWFRESWAKAGKKLDMGKACIRFKKVDDLALDVLGEALRKFPVSEYLKQYEAALAQMGKGKSPGAKGGAAKGAKGAKRAATSRAKAPAAKRKASAGSSKPASKKRTAKR